MLVSYKWICEIAGFSPDPEELAHKLTFSGLEVDDLRHRGPEFEKIFVGEIKTKEPHPESKKLSLVTVDVGNEVLPVVCGAPNCPGPGGKVAVAVVGAEIGEIVIAERKVAGAVSRGMICSEDELDLGPDGDGIMILNCETDAVPGTPLVEALDLEDWIYELGVTPNRPDALAHRGVAREAALMFGRPFEETARQRPKEAGAPVEEMVKVSIEDSQGCPRYGAAAVRGVEIKPSPFALRYRLHNLGIRPISNMVDITNLICLEYGQPLHAFDASKVVGKEIIVRRAKEGEKMKTLDELEREFVADDLLICDKSGPVAVAGVMGGLDSGVEEKTKDIIIECAYFDPRTVRKTSKRLKLTSESSYRFERGVDPSRTMEVLEATVSLIAQQAGGARAPGLIDVHPAPVPPAVVKFRPSRFEKIMGYGVEPARIREILQGLGGKLEGDDDSMAVTVPQNRPDVTREIDLIEEVARIDGLHNIPTVLPKIQSRVPEREEFEAARRVREMLSGMGLTEAVTYSFVPRSLLEALGRGDATVAIANPLSSERDVMRTSLLAGLLENLVRATSRYESVFRQFEVGRTFHEEGRELPKEVLRVAGVLSGPRDSWPAHSSERIDFYDAKGIVQQFVHELTGVMPVFQPVESAGFHPARACEVMMAEKSVGVMGELHPSTLASTKLQKGVVGFELQVMELWKSRIVSSAKALSDFPPMVRDVAFLVGEEQDAGPMGAALREACGELATGVELFDVYRGKGVEDGHKSLAFSVTYRSFEKTLTDHEVDSLHRGAVEKVSTKFSARMR